MADLNRVYLIGNLTRDPQMRYTPAGMGVAEFGLATNRRYTTKSGEKRDEATFVDIVVWGRSAEVCCEYLKKGSPALIEGRLSYRQWESKEGQKRSKLEVVADRVQFLSSRRSGEGAGQGGEAGAPPPADTEPEPAAPPAGEEEPPF